MDDSLSPQPPPTLSTLRHRKGHATDASLSPDSQQPHSSQDDDDRDDDGDTRKQQHPPYNPQRAFDAMLLLVTFMAFFTRCWNIGDPAQVVFDEVHFGKFASYYLRREYYFDVHPPLGKLLLAAVGYAVGYDGHFLFDHIGDDYIEHNVPYVALRLLPATCGALIVPVVFLILKELGLSVAGATFGAFLIILGIALACTTGVKMVGLLTIAAVGIAVLFDLWNILDYRRGLSLREFARHFSARALCLIFLPLVVYLAFFYIHFAILVKSGPGDAFMSPAFQDGLLGSEMNTNTSAIPYFANITLRHRETTAYLHSHADKYPLRYDDGRISTQGQQVTGYPHRDLNNHWTIEPVDPALYPSAAPYTPTAQETERNVRYVRPNDLVRLRHARTNSHLITHDVASPLTPTQMEVTTLPASDTSRYNETLWKIQLVTDDSSDKLWSKRAHFRLVNAIHNVAVHCHKGQLPDWGFGQQEINGNKALKESNNVWWIDQVDHARIINGTEIGEPIIDPKTQPKKPTLPFLSKFVELQSLMIAHNAGLTKPHPYSSTPITWPFVLRGISFWERKANLRQIYLLGNPLIWWLSITGTVMYAAMWIMDRVLLRRGIDDFGPIRTWWDNAIGFLFLTWLTHYLPFFLQGRMLFLHHYLPSFIFSVLVLVCTLEFCFVRVWSSQGLHRSMVRPSRPYIMLLSVFVVGAAWGYWYFAPLTYGIEFESVESLKSRKWLSSWDLQHA
ncbi:dolichyl-phosphate-mannose---protein mannosyltransferase [Spizellomyces sp. 'palustris']|nr:dolichyl-phosphate-mannose---protein mannosyltransferase [Spizellomyces sp. 'palustris']